jgi:hypothetical protein
MLRWTMLVLHAQRPFTRGDAYYTSQLAAGIRFFQNYYGGELIEELRALLHAHHWGGAARDLLVLMRYYPRGIVERLARRARAAVGLARS